MARDLLFLLIELDLEVFDLQGHRRHFLETAVLKHESSIS